MLSELQLKYCNAKKTGMACLGHWKAQRNEERVEKYEKELKENGERIPTYEEMKEHGVFNGDGAY